MLTASYRLPDGRQVHSTTRFHPAALEHLIPRQHLGDMAKGLSEGGAGVGNFDVFIRGRDRGTGGYDMQTTIDARENGAVCSAAHVQRVANGIRDFVFGAQELPEGVRQTTDVTDASGKAVPPSSMVGDLIRGVAGAFALLADTVTMWLKNIVFWSLRPHEAAQVRP